MKSLAGCHIANLFCCVNAHQNDRAYVLTYTDVLTCIPEPNHTLTPARIKWTMLQCSRSMSSGRKTMTHLSLFSSFCSKSQTVCTPKYGPILSCWHESLLFLTETSTQPVWFFHPGILLSFSLFFLPVAPIPASSSLSNPLLTPMGRICQPVFFFLPSSLGSFHLCQSGSSRGIHPSGLYRFFSSTRMLRLNWS